LNETEIFDGATGEGESAELGRIVFAITEEIQRWAAGARAGVIAEFVAKVSYARKQLPRNQLIGAVRACYEARAAALALIKRQAAADLIGRREAAIREHRNKRPARPSARRKPTSEPDHK
jgi:hypothetical protein